MTFAYVETTTGRTCWRCWLLGHRMTSQGSKAIRVDGHVVFSRTRTRVCTRCWREEEFRWLPVDRLKAAQL